MQIPPKEAFRQLLARCSLISKTCLCVDRVVQKLDAMKMDIPVHISTGFFTCLQPEEYPRGFMSTNLKYSNCAVKVIQLQARHCCPVGNVCSQVTSQIGKLMWLKTGIRYPLATTSHTQSSSQKGSVLFIWPFVEKRGCMWKKWVYWLFVLSLPTARKERLCRWKPSWFWKWKQKCWEVEGLGSTLRFRIAADKTPLGASKFAIEINLKSRPCFQP